LKDDIKLADQYVGKGVDPFIETHRNIEEIKRRPVVLPKDIAMHRDGTVVVGVQPTDIDAKEFYRQLGCDVQMGQPKLKIASADGVMLHQPPRGEVQQKLIKQLQQIGMGIFSCENIDGAVLLLSLSQAAEVRTNQSQADRFAINLSRKTEQPLAVIVRDESPEEWMALETIKPSLIILSPSDNRLHYCRRFFEWLQIKEIHVPVILNFCYDCSQEDLVIQAAAEYGALLCDGLGDGIWLEAPYGLDFLRNLSFNMLQSARMRTFKTDFISCPSCGRTLFDLQDVTKRIRSRTAHLPGVKIAIMGCIVNGPGEMADADFGYVGSKPGMIDLYVGKTCVEKDIDFTDADNRLVELIKKHGRWAEPEGVSMTHL